MGIYGIGLKGLESNGPLIGIQLGEGRGRGASDAKRFLETGPSLNANRFGPEHPQPFAVCVRVCASHAITAPQSRVIRRRAWVILDILRPRQMLGQMPYSIKPLLRSKLSLLYFTHFGPAHFQSGLGILLGSSN